MNIFVFALVMGLSTFAFAADFQCFEFTSVETGNQGRKPVPAIVTYRDPLSDVVLRQEIIPLNEEVEDTLNSIAMGSKICLKGRKGYGSLSKFFAYSVAK